MDQIRSGFVFSRFANRLTGLVDLLPEELELLSRMPSTIAQFDAHQTILTKGEQPKQCSLLLQGYLCWQEVRGRERQITSIYVPADIPDLAMFYGARTDGNLVALGSVVIAFVPYAFFKDLCAASSEISRALLLVLLVDHAIQRNWTVSLGSRNALARVAHLLCEITVRQQNVGLAKDFRLAASFTQSDLAAACGISPVHANRIIQELRRANLLQWHSSLITITNWNGMARLAEFDQTYLGSSLKERASHSLRPPSLPNLSNRSAHHPKGAHLSVA